MGINRPHGRPVTIAVDTPLAWPRSRREQLMAEVLSRGGAARNDAWRSDVRDAITCALIAWLQRKHPERLEAPTDAADGAEGWIWLPAPTPFATRPPRSQAF